MPMDQVATHDHDAHDHKPGFFVRWFFSTNHKDIGTLYLIFAIVAGIVGGAISGVMRAELAAPDIQYLHLFADSSPADLAALGHMWNVFITAHGLIMVFFALGVSTLIIGLGLGAREAIRSRAQALRGIAERSKPILGVTFIAVGLMLFLNFHHVIEAWALQVMPIWLQDLSVAL